MTCRHCGKSISILRRLSDAEFCVPEHRRLFIAMQQHLAFARLTEAHQKLSTLPKAAIRQEQLAASDPDRELAGEPKALGELLSLFPRPQTGEETFRNQVQAAAFVAKPVKIRAALTPVPDWLESTAAQNEEPKPVSTARGPRLFALLPVEPAEPLASPAEVRPIGWETRLPVATHVVGVRQRLDQCMRTRPDFLELCLSFLRTAGVLEPVARPITPRPAAFIGEALRLPVVVTQGVSTMPTVNGPEQEQSTEAAEEVSPEGLELAFPSRSGLQRPISRLPEVVIAPVGIARMLQSAGGRLATPVLSQDAGLLPAPAMAPIAAGSDSQLVPIERLPYAAPLHLTPAANPPVQLGGRTLAQGDWLAAGSQVRAAEPAPAAVAGALVGALSGEADRKLPSRVPKRATDLPLAGAVAVKVRIPARSNKV